MHAEARFRVIINVMEQSRLRRRRSSGFSLIELLIVIAIILIILTIAVPKMGVAQMNAREMAVVREIQTINTAQAQYNVAIRQICDLTLAELGPPASGGPGPSAADLIPGSLASGDKDGYTFILAATPSGFALNAIRRYTTVLDGGLSTQTRT